jgi:hypothetical protein
MLSINVPPVQYTQNYSSDTTIPIPRPPKSGPKAKKDTRKDCLEHAAQWRRNSLAMGVNKNEANSMWTRQVTRCLLTTPGPLPQLAFNPWSTGTPAPQPPKTTIAGGARMLAFVPLQVRGSIVAGIFDLFRPKPKAKPKKSWADRQECIDKELNRQINAQEKVDNAAARKLCGG